ncbi:hypothetical protein FOA43_001015 [Brettanomyces nanus]|uniref:Phosphatidate phosphatase APP1 catalytic domain-containing protein n=1 Tax=Eeniella nana TaxID=13502 RepID=A0A875S0R2_EENNA|nr:uncharacterized protein FOA43_001015 [Brettanomyces nanus]QPG73702.1 hypothetical protein FOA43_001015 [Brettanomyces nanus]
MDQSDEDAAEMSKTQELQSYLAIGRRKFHSAVNATKQSSYYKKVTQRFNGDNSSSEDDSVPENAFIQLYNSYSRETSPGSYFTKVSGGIFTPGRLNRKNRMMLSLAKRMARASVPYSAADQFEDQFAEAIEHPINQTHFEEYDDDDTSSSGSQVAVDNVAEEITINRMSGVIAAGIPRTLLRIRIGSQQEAENIITNDLYTDQYGMFMVEIQTEYAPSYVEASSTINLEVIQLEDIRSIPLKGLSVISDVDDTVRITGVVGDKIDIFRNIFSRPYSECEVPGVPKWFQIMDQHFGCAIHYVSNSPWQVYNIVSGFLEYENMPMTSIHLKQYFGNIFSSVRMASSERKKGTLEQIIRDFPQRKFILLGDSGEQDIEAYVSLIPEFGNQILAIYIRAVAGSFSSLGNDRDNVKRLERMLSKNKSQLHKPKTISQQPLPRRIPPIVPHKPSELHGKPINRTSRTRLRRSISMGNNPPRLPARRIPEISLPEGGALLDRDQDHHHLPWLNSSPLPDTLDEFPGDFNQNSVVLDLKFETWKERTAEVVKELPAEIELKFWWNPEDIMKECFDLLKANS